MRHRRSSSVAFTAVLAFVVSSSAAASQLVFFGDSLSDPGNHFIATHASQRQPFSPVPSASYDIGGHHFSNGATWAEQLAIALGEPHAGLPALRQPGSFTDYAVGNARARSGSAFAFDLGTQVSNFLQDSGGAAPADDTYVIWIGPNDVRDALDALAVDSSGATSLQILKDAVEAIVANIQLLLSRGAQSFLIVNVPDFGLTPLARSLGPQAVAAASFFSLAFDGGLAQAVGALQAATGANLKTLDAFTLLHQIVALPQTFGLADVTDACLAFGVVGNAVCANPDSHLFWDGIHPTVAGHAILAASAGTLLAP